MPGTYTLNDGTTIPAIGFGTYPLTGADGVTAIASAIGVGYRLLDTAVNYGNEEEVGEAIRRSGVPRDELLVTSKIPGRHHGYDDAIASTKDSLHRLGLDQLDLHLIHWPNPRVGRYVEAWQALVDLQKQGLVR
jgi:2,5-diketo-D-gluconate reductase A